MSEHPRALGALRKACDDQEPEVASAAIAAIGVMGGEQATELLADILGSRHLHLRSAALVALLDSKDTKLIAGLTARLQDKDAGIRSRAARLIAALTARLQDENAGIRSGAARLLQRAHWKPSGIMEQVWFNIGLGKINDAAACGPEAIDPLEKLTRSGHPSHQVAAVRALGRISDERVLNVLLPRLQSSEYSVSLASIDALTRFGGPKAAYGIAGALQHPNHQVRATAAEALAIVPAKNITQALTRLLKDKHWDVRRAAATTLGRIVDPLATDSLIELLADADYDVRESAVFSLGRLRDLRAIGPLVMALVDTETSVRRTAAFSLQRIHTGWAQTEDAQKRKPDIRATMLNSDDVAVRYAARSVLKVLGGEAQKTEEYDIASSLTAANHKHIRIFTFFFYLMGDTDREVRLAAAETLGRLGDRRASSALMSALSDSDSHVKAAAERSLEALGTS